MKHQRHLAFIAAAVIVVSLVPTADAGGNFGLYVGGSGFGVSVGFGDWGVHTRSWADPHWSINFEATLSGYGEWVWVGGVGRVWRPWVAAGWQPYLHGRWVHTVHGWNWVAFEPWGYVPHHYGNWAYCSLGWVWVPGFTYSGANVVWVRAGGYVGWYARPPRGWSHASRGFHHGYRHGFRDGYDTGYRDGWHDARYATYVDWRDFGSENVSHHAVEHSTASRSRIQDRATVPTPGEIRQRGGSEMSTVQVSRRTVNMAGREITIARPEGVAPSIERHALETVSRTLSSDALEQRQPMVRSRSGTSSADSGERRSDARKPLRLTEEQRRGAVREEVQRAGKPLSSPSTGASQRGSSSLSIPSRQPRASVPVSNGRHQDDSSRSESSRVSVRRQSASPGTSGRTSSRGSTTVERSSTQQRDRLNRSAGASQPDRSGATLRRVEVKPRSLNQGSERTRNKKPVKKETPEATAKRRR